MSALTQASQALRPGAIVQLFRLNAAAVGGGDYYFTPGAFGSQPIKFGGVNYTPADVEFTKMEVNGQGALPRPHMRVSNTNGVFQTIVNTYGDMLGCTVQRVRTFSQFLDGQAQADPTMYWGPDTFRVEQKVDENAVFIEWELSADFDQEGKMLPGRQVIRDTCLWRYRRYDPVSGTFVYTRAQCPYTGTAYFDRNDQPTTKDKDEPSRQITCCEKRFGKGQPLPYGGFPGVARVRP